MSHEVENRNGQDCVFVVGQPAWHGLGTVLENPPTVEEGIAASGLGWVVTKEPIFCGGIEIPGKVAVVRSDDKKVLGIVGEDYSVVQNKEAFDWFQPWLDTDQATLESGGSLFGGSKIWVMAKVKIDPMDVIPGDPVESYILLSNSHDGSMAVRAGFTNVRVVCSNTLGMATQSRSSKLLKVRHKGDVVNTLNQIQQVMDLHKKEFEATMAQYKVLANTQISSDTFKKYVRTVFTKEETAPVDLVSSDDDGRRMENKLMELFEGGIGMDIPGVSGTLWAAYNAVTEHTTHHRGRSQENRINSLWFGESKRVNDKALREALKLAAVF